MRKYISPHYLLSGLLGMLALVLSVSCDDTDVVRRVDPQIEVQADLFYGSCRFTASIAASFYLSMVCRSVCFLD